MVKTKELALLSGAGKGTIVQKLAEGERLLGGVIAPKGKGLLMFETDKGRLLQLDVTKVAGARASRGELVTKKDKPVKVVMPAPTAPAMREET